MPKMRIAMNQDMLVPVSRVWVLLLTAIILAGCGTAPAPSAAPTPAAPTAVPAATAAAAAPTAAPAVAAPTTAAAAQPQAVTLTFAFPDDAISSAAAMAQIAAYSGDHPQVQVVAKPFPAADYARKLLESVDSNATDIDLFVSSDSLLPALINRKAALDLQALLAKQS